MNYAELVIAAGRRMLSEGVTIGAWGNISAFNRERGEVYITPSVLLCVMITYQP